MPTPLLMLGQSLDGRYQVLQVIETGRSSQVCIAEDALQSGNPLCLIKCYRPASTDQLSLERARQIFHTEARKLRQLSDRTEQVPQLLAYFEQNQEFYLVEELIDGVTLKAELQQQSYLTEVEIIGLLVDVLQTLKIAHEFGVVHADINPNNLVFRNHDRKLVLTNFAQIKLISTPRSHSDSLPSIGTPSYMPIEQAQGIMQPDCDIYALGLTVIQALTGVHPSELEYNAKTETIIWSSQTQISQELEAVLERMVKRKSIDRYQSASEVLDDLKIVMQPFAETDVRVKPNKSADSQKFLIIGGFGVFSIAVLVGFSFGLSQYVPNLSLIQTPTQISPQTPIPTARPSTKPSTQKTSKPPKKTAKLQKVKPKSPTKVSPRSIQANISTPDPTASVAKLKLVSTLAGHKGWVRTVAFFPNGNSFASGSYDRTVRLWDLKKRTTSTTLSKHSGFASGVNAIAIHPLGNIFATANLDKTIKLWDFKSGLPMRTITGHTDQVFSVAFDPSGKTIVSGSADNTVKLWNLKTRTLIRTLSGHTAPVFAVAVSPNGKFVASGSKDKTIKLWNLETGAEVFSLKGHTAQVRSISFSPDRKTLASGSQDKTIKLWDVATGKEIRTLSGHDGTVLSVAFSPDGRSIASGSFDTTVRLWNTATGQPIQKLISHTAPVFSVAFNPKNNTLISGSVDKTIKIWR